MSQEEIEKRVDRIDSKLDEVLEYVIRADTKTNDEICAELHISKQTLWKFYDQGCKRVSIHKARLSVVKKFMEEAVTKSE
jgi:FixJ family two-component response regulator